MRRASLPAAITALAVLALAGPAVAAVPNPFAGQGAGPVAGFAGAQRPAGPGDGAGLARGLTPAQLAGQRVVFSFPGTRVPAGLLRRIRSGEAAGVILFSRNVTSRRQVRRLTRRLQRAARSRTLPEALRGPLLIMVDQEGGEVRRIPGSPVASPAAIGRTGRVSVARRAGRAGGDNLRSVGVNVNLAPVVDVGRAGGTIARYERSFGSSAALVSRLGAGFVRGLRSAGVAATAKHFPGFGAAIVNTDDAPVTLSLSRATLRRVDEPPFAAAIRAGAELVMISSAVYPALHARVPATFSRRIIGGELRDRLGFQGVVVTDALGVPGITAYGTPAQLAERSARAGSDLLLYSERYAEGVRGARALERALRAGRLDRDAFVESVQRVLALRAARSAR